MSLFWCQQPLRSNWSVLYVISFTSVLKNSISTTFHCNCQSLNDRSGTSAKQSRMNLHWFDKTTLMEKSSVISSTPWKPDDKCLSLLWKGSLLAFLISFHQELPCIWYKLLLYSFTMSSAIMMLIVSSGLYTCFTDYYLPLINYTDKSANNANTCIKVMLDFSLYSLNHHYHIVRLTKKASSRCYTVKVLYTHTYQAGEYDY